MNAASDTRRPVVVGIDGSPHGQRALDWAASEAALRGSSLVVLTAVPASYPAVRAGVPGQPTTQPTSVIGVTAEHALTAALDHVRLRHPDLDLTGHTVVGDAGD